MNDDKLTPEDALAMAKQVLRQLGYVDDGRLCIEMCAAFAAPAPAQEEASSDKLLSEALRRLRVWREESLDGIEMLSECGDRNPREWVFEVFEPERMSPCGRWERRGCAWWRKIPDAPPLSSTLREEAEARGPLGEAWLAEAAALGAGVEPPEMPISAFPDVAEFYKDDPSLPTCPTGEPVAWVAWEQSGDCYIRPVKPERLVGGWCQMPSGGVVRELPWLKDKGAWADDPVALYPAGSGDVDLEKALDEEQAIWDAAGEPLAPSPEPVATLTVEWEAGEQSRSWSRKLGTLPAGTFLLYAHPLAYEPPASDPEREGLISDLLEAARNYDLHGTIVGQSLEVAQVTGAALRLLKGASHPRLYTRAEVDAEVEALAKATAAAFAASPAPEQEEKSPCGHWVKREGEWWNYAGQCNRQGKDFCFQCGAEIPADDPSLSARPTGEPWAYMVEGPGQSRIVSVWAARRPDGYLDNPEYTCTALYPAGSGDKCSPGSGPDRERGDDAPMGGNYPIIPDPERIAAWQEMERRVLACVEWNEQHCPDNKRPCSGAISTWEWCVEPRTGVPLPASYTQEQVLAALENVRKAGFACGSCGEFQDTHWFCPICTVVCQQIAAAETQAVATVREEIAKATAAAFAALVEATRENTMGEVREEMAAAYADQLTSEVAKAREEEREEWQAERLELRRLLDKYVREAGEAEGKLDSLRSQPAPGSAEVRELCEKLRKQRSDCPCNAEFPCPACSLAEEALAALAVVRASSPPSASYRTITYTEAPHPDSVEVPSRRSLERAVLEAVGTDVERYHAAGRTGGTDAWIAIVVAYDALLASGWPAGGGEEPVVVSIRPVELSTQWAVTAGRGKVGRMMNWCKDKRTALIWAMGLTDSLRVFGLNAVLAADGSE